MSAVSAAGGRKKPVMSLQARQARAEVKEESSVGEQHRGQVHGVRRVLGRVVRLVVRLVMRT